MIVSNASHSTTARSSAPPSPARSLIVLAATLAAPLLRGLSGRLRLVPHKTAAERALQGSSLKILDQSARFDGRASFRTWLFGVVRRTAAEQWRRAALRRLLPLAVLEAAPDGRPDPAVALARAEATRRLEAALASLSRRQREVLHLVFYQDLSIAEAAAVAGHSR